MDNMEFEEVFTRVRQYYPQWEFPQVVKTLWWERMQSRSLQTTLTALDEVYAAGQAQFFREVLPNILRNIRTCSTPSPSKSNEVQTYKVVFLDWQEGDKTPKFFSYGMPPNLTDEQCRQSKFSTMAMLQGHYGGRWKVIEPGEAYEERSPF